MLDARIETRYREFNDTSDLPTNSLRTGWQTRLGGTYSYYLTPGFVLTTQGYDQREDAEVGLLRRLGDGGFGAASPGPSTIRCGRRNIPGPSRWAPASIRRHYDDPDPTINPNEAEVDTVWWTRGALVSAGGGNLGFGASSRVSRPAIRIMIYMRSPICRLWLGSRRGSEG